MDKLTGYEARMHSRRTFAERSEAAWRFNRAAAQGIGAFAACSAFVCAASMAAAALQGRSLSGGLWVALAAFSLTACASALLCRHLARPAVDLDAFERAFLGGGRAGSAQASRGPHRENRTDAPLLIPAGVVAAAVDGDNSSSGGAEA